MKHSFAALFLAFVMIAAAVVADSASAQDQIYLAANVERAASDVVNGRVISIQNAMHDGQPHRVAEFEITGSPKGDLSGIILIEASGGVLADGRRVQLSHTPYLVLGDSLQLAIIETPDSVGSGLASALRTERNVYSIAGGPAGVHALLPPGVGRASAAGDFSTGISWENFDAPVQYKVNPANSRLTEAATIAAVQRGFRLWENDANSSVDFDYAGTTTKSAFDSPGEIVVSFGYPPPGSAPGWLGTTAWWPDAQGNITEFDVLMNRNVFWVNGATYQRSDLGSAIAHEVGHGLGINHSLTIADLMFPQIETGRVKPLGPGDRAAVSYLYPLRAFCAGELVTVDLNRGESPTSGNDVILGTPGDDVINARDGDDIVCAGRGNDTVDGGHGDDYIEGGHQGDYLYGGQGNDRLIGESGNDRLFGEGGDDELFGNSGNDKLYGSNGVDLLRGGDGRDSLYGDGGNDKLYGGDEADRLYGGDDQDRLYGDDGEDRLYGADGDDMMYGGADADILHGSRGDDLLDGGGGNDALNGGSNSDNCDGAGGIDTAERCEIRVSAS